MAENYDEPRKIGIVTVDIAFDWTGIPVMQDVLDWAGDVLNGLLTAYMKKFAPDSVLVYWQLAEPTVRMTTTVPEKEYTEGRLLSALTCAGRD